MDTNLLEFFMSLPVVEEGKIGESETVTDVTGVTKSDRGGTALEPTPAPSPPTVAADPAQRPPLPQELWVLGIATFGEARRVQLELAKEYVTHLGKAGDTYYVAGPGNGLNSKRGE